MKMMFESQVLFLGIFDIGNEVFSFSSYADALKSKDLILEQVKSFCRVRFVVTF